jgi:hypothetical protein
MAGPDQKPEDFIFSDIPRTKKEAIGRTAEARVTMTVKSALQSYLSRYFDHNGTHRNQLSLTAGFTVNYETRISGPRDNEDPTIYQVQLARYWQELRQKLPCILIVDTGFERHPAGLGGITNSQHVNASLSKVELAMLATVPIELQVASLDETTSGDLRDALMYIFGTLTHLNKGHVILSERPEDRWEVRIPLTETSSGLERRNVTDDPKDSLWSTTVGLEMVFEGLTTISFDRQVQETTLSDGTVVGVGVGAGSAARLGLMYEVGDQFSGVDPLGFRLSDGRLVPLPDSQPSLDSIVVPSTINLHQDTPIQADWIPAWAEFVSDNPRIALIDPSTCTIHPKRPGSFNLLLMDPRTPDGPSIIRSWAVTVKLS